MEFKSHVRQFPEIVKFSSSFHPARHKKEEFTKQVVAANTVNWIKCLLSNSYSHKIWLITLLRLFMHHHISRMFTTCGGSPREREEKFLSRSRSRRTELELNALSFVAHSLLFAAWFWKEKFFMHIFLDFYFVRSCSLEMKVTARNEIQQQLLYIYLQENRASICSIPSTNSQIGN